MRENCCHIAGTDLGSTLAVLIGSDLEATQAVPIGTDLEARLAVPIGTDLEATMAVPIGTDLEATMAVPIGTDLEAKLAVPIGADLGATMAVPIGTDLEAKLAVPIGTDLELFRVSSGKLSSTSCCISCARRRFARIAFTRARDRHRLTPIQGAGKEGGHRGKYTSPAYHRRQWPLCGPSIFRRFLRELGSSMRDRSFPTPRPLLDPRGPVD
jgi:hypothetical protein